MSSRHESRVERQIREAQERGEFDNLPGAGKPLPGHGGTYDENWWIRDWVRRENLTDIGPASLRIRKEAEQLPQRLARESSEPAVRAIVTALNERIVLARRGLVDGPPVVLPTFDVERVVETWRRQRGASG
ncbi:DnaJ family domain-containing protein [Plantactinospora sp. ZYX-F-223]|uniref:DnaJ family domain-containing protein n=1 Tax=Plantactinospora sp. ZYX-F-223 TaxID=3144103 RepID=UPI0031FDE2C6